MLDKDHDIYLIAESTSREVIEDMMRSLPFLDDVDGLFKSTEQRHVVICWNREVERDRIQAWGRHYYPTSMHYGIHFSEIADFEHIRSLREER